MRRFINSALGRVARWLPPSEILGGHVTDDESALICCCRAAVGP
jgi:hypothetical protein